MEINENHVRKPNASLSMRSVQTPLPKSKRMMEWPLIPATTSGYWEALGRPFCTPSSLANTDTNTNTSLPDTKLDTHKEIPPSPIYPQQHCRNVSLQIKIHKPKSNNKIREEAH